MKKFNARLCALFAILLTTVTTHSWEWPWNTKQARTWTQQLAQYQARLRSLWANRPNLFRTNPQVQQDRQNIQDGIARNIRRYWIISEKKEEDMTVSEKVQRYLLVTDLSECYDFLKNLKSYNAIDIKTLQLLEDWHYKYVNNKPDIHQKQK